MQMPNDKKDNIISEQPSDALEERGQPPQQYVAASEQKACPVQVLFTVWVSLAAFVCNFDTAFGGVVLLMPSYRKAFGSCQMIPNDDASKTGAATGASGPAMVEDCQLTATQQSLISITYLFLGVGGYFSGSASDYLGRRTAIQIGAVISIIGAAGMLGTAGSFANYLVCKSIGAVGLGLLFTIGPIYGVECAPPQSRGFLVSLYNFGHSLGNLAASAVCLGSSRISSGWAWKTPIACQIPIGLVFGLGMFVFPESPRWLLIKKKDDKARQAFGRFYRLDPASNAITAQVRAVKIDLEKELPVHPSFIEIFHQSQIRRTLIACLILCGIGVTGLAFVIPYGAVFLQAVGIGNPYLVNVIMGGCVLAGTLPGPVVVEKLGRRMSLLSGSIGMATSMLLFAIVGSSLGQAARASQLVIIVFLCIWAFIFAACVAPCAWVASAEMHSVAHRSYGQAFASMAYQVFSFASAFWSPYMINEKYGNMGSSVGYFYGGLSIVYMTLVYFLVPETGKLTLEQIDVFFRTGLPARKTSIKRNNNILQGIILMGDDQTEEDKENYVEKGMC